MGPTYRGRKNKGFNPGEGHDRRSTKEKGEPNSIYYNVPKSGLAVAQGFKRTSSFWGVTTRPNGHVGEDKWEKVGGKEIIPIKSV